MDLKVQRHNGAKHVLEEPDSQFKGSWLHDTLHLPVISCQAKSALIGYLGGRDLPIYGVGYLQMFWTRDDNI